MYHLFKCRMILTIIVLFLSPINSLYAVGFLIGTPVKTPNGYIPIEQLHINSPVYCYDGNGNFIVSSVTQVVCQRIPYYIEIIVDGCSIGVAPDQQFFLAQEKRWIQAQDLIASHGLLMDCTRIAYVSDVRLVNQEVDVYDITVAQYHNFCVTSFDLHVHNFLPIFAGLSVAFGLGGIEITGMGIATALAGIGIGFSMRHKNGKHEATFELGPNAGAGAGDPNDDDKHKGRKKNGMSKSEFFNQEEVKKNYESYRDGIYRKKSGAEGIEKAEYIQWDHLHNDVEAYSKSKKHIGSIDPKTLKLYKDPVGPRKIDI